MFKLVVLSVVLAAATADPLGLWGGVATPLAASWGAPLAAVAPLGVSNYRGPLSLAPGQPANILAADGRPLDTLDVNVDKAVHLTAKALEGGHWLKKRSIVAPVVAAPLAAAPLGWGRSIVAPAPLAIASPVAPLGLGVARVGLW